MTHSAGTALLRYIPSSDGALSEGVPRSAGGSADAGAWGAKVSGAFNTLVPHTTPPTTTTPHPIPPPPSLPLSDQSAYFFRV
jgi:hypothetical protein